MSRTTPQLSILTANRLGDGTVVFLDSEGTWKETIAEAAVARSPDEAKALEARGARDAARNMVVDPYFAEVREIGGRIEPIRYRERVRAGGPTVLDDVPGYVSPAPPASPVSPHTPSRAEAA
jgi:sulfite reductase (NADPH) hemoprotein beta-component